MRQVTIDPYRFSSLALWEQPHGSQHTLLPRPQNSLELITSYISVLCPVLQVSGSVLGPVPVLFLKELSPLVDRHKTPQQKVVVAEG